MQSLKASRLPQENLSNTDISYIKNTVSHRVRKTLPLRIKREARETEGFVQ